VKQVALLCRPPCQVGENRVGVEEQSKPNKTECQVISPSSSEVDNNTSGALLSRGQLRYKDKEQAVRSRQKKNLKTGHKKNRRAIPKRGRDGMYEKKGGFFLSSTHAGGETR